MVKHSTLIFTFSNIGDEHSKKEDFLVKGLNGEFAPSEDSVRNIMAFAKAHSAEKTKSVGVVEMVLN